MDFSSRRTGSRRSDVVRRDEVPHFFLEPRLRRKLDDLRRNLVHRNEDLGNYRRLGRSTNTERPLSNSQRKSSQLVRWNPANSGWRGRHDIVSFLKSVTKGSGDKGIALQRAHGQIRQRSDLGVEIPILGKPVFESQHNLTVIIFG